MAAKQLPNQSGSMPNMPIPETPYGAAKEKVASHIEYLMGRLASIP
jgi:hypothetical protein